MVEGEEKCPYFRLGPKLKDKEYALTGQTDLLVIHPDKISVVQEGPDGKEAWSQL